MRDTKVIRAEIKEDLGYNSRQVSVKRDCSSLRFTVRDNKVDYKRLENYVSKYENISRDYGTGEILCGGNTFVDVYVDDKVLDALESINISSVVDDMNSVDKNSWTLAMYNGTKIVFRSEYYGVAAKINDESYGVANERELRKVMYKAGLFNSKPTPKKIEWELDLKISLDGKQVTLGELPSTVLDDLVNEVMSGGLRDKADGEFECVGA